MGQAKEANLEIAIRRPAYGLAPYLERYTVYVEAISLSERVTLSDPLNKDKIFITIELENLGPGE